MTALKKRFFYQQYCNCYKSHDLFIIKPKQHPSTLPNHVPTRHILVLAMIKIQVGDGWIRDHIMILKINNYQCFFLKLVSTPLKNEWIYTHNAKKTIKYTIIVFNIKHSFTALLHPSVKYFSCTAKNTSDSRIICLHY